MKKLPHPAPTPESEVNVYTVTMAPSHVGIWYGRLIRDAVQILRAPALPIEIGSTGKFWASAPEGRDTNPERRIRVTSKVCFWTSENFVHTYVHELAHALQREHENDTNLHGHDAAFFALNMALMLRLDAAAHMGKAGILSWSLGMTQYDLSDPPICWKEWAPDKWKPRAYAWAMTQAHELFDKDLTALELAAEINARYWVWADSMIDEPAVLAKQAEQRKAALKRQVSELQDLKEKLRIRTWLLLGSCTFSFSIVALMLR